MNKRVYYCFVKSEEDSRWLRGSTFCCLDLSKRRQKPIRDIFSVKAHSRLYYHMIRRRSKTSFSLRLVLSENTLLHSWRQAWKSLNQNLSLSLCSLLSSERVFISIKRWVSQWSWCPSEALTQPSSTDLTLVPPPRFALPVSNTFPPHATISPLHLSFPVPVYVSGLPQIPSLTAPSSLPPLPTRNLWVLVVLTLLKNL